MLAAVVLNWRAPEATVKTVKALLQGAIAPDLVVVVDNDSGDSSVEMFKSLPGPTELVESPANLGYAGGNNLGIQHALRAGADYVFIVNNDLIVDVDCLRTMLLVLCQGDAQIAVPKIWLAGPGSRLWFAGGTLDLDRARSIHIQDGRYDDKQLLELNFVTGAALLVERSVFEAIGYLDERYFLYWEDADYSVRASIAGFRMVYVPQAQATHDVGLSSRSERERDVIPGRSRTFYFYMARNRLLFLRKFLSGGRLLRALCYATLWTTKDLARLVARERVDRSGKAASVIRGFAAGAVNISRRRTSTPV